MRNSRSIRMSVAMLGCLVALLVAAPAASAQGYPGGPTLVVSDVNPVCGEAITISGTDFLPDATVTVSFNQAVVGTTVSDSAGNWSFPYAIACTAVGRATISATDGVNVLGISLTVRADGETRQVPAAVGTLPRTGSDNTNLIRIGVVLLAVGGMAVLATRKRAADKAAIDG
jgi:LPXTG-motif cell wall-anchored protein